MAQLKVTEEEKQREMERVQKILFNEDVYISIKDVQGPSRESTLTFHRALIAIVLREEGKSFARIGAYLNRDHATIINLTKYNTKRCGRNDEYEEKKKMLSNTNIKEKIKFYEAKIKTLKTQIG